MFCVRKILLGLLLLVLTVPNLHAATQWAVVIGISEYVNLPQAQWLHYAHQDARSFSDLLKSRMVGVPAENVRLLMNEGATTRDIKEALGTWLRDHSGPDDTVYVYFAGHGVVDDKQNEAYFVTYDTKPGEWYSTAYGMLDLKRILTTLQYRHLILITDACKSANVGTDKFGGRDLEMPKINDFLNNTIVTENQNVEKSEFVFTAAGSVEKSFEGDQWGDGHGVFTHYLIEGLQGKADKDGDGRINAAEIVGYVQANVQRDTGNLQHPTLANAAKLDYNLLLASTTDRPNVPSPAVPSPTARLTAATGPALGTMLLTSELGSVQVRIDDEPPVALGPQEPALLTLNPGEHSVKAERAGFKPASYKLNVNSGVRTSQVIALDPELIPAGDWRTRLTSALQAPKPADVLKQLETLFGEVSALRPGRPLAGEELAVVQDVFKNLADQYTKAKQTVKVATLIQKFYEAFPIFPENTVAADSDVGQAVRKASAVLGLKIEPAPAVVEIDSDYSTQLEGQKEVLVAPGQHRIRVTRVGYQPLTVDYLAQAGDSKSVSETLKLARISAFVFAETPGVQVVRDDGSTVAVVPFTQAAARIRPDQQDRLTSELRRQNLNQQTIGVAILSGLPSDTAEIKLRITKDKYKTDEVRMNFSDLQTKLFATAGDYVFDRVVRLDKLMGKLDVSSTPRGADVLIDGNKIGVTPLNLAYEIGDYELTVKYAKTWKYKDRISVKDGETVKRDATLKPTLVFLGIHSPNDAATKKPLIDPQKYRDLEAQIQKKIPGSFENYFVESQNPDKYEYTRDFLLKSMSADAPAEVRRHLQAMRDRFESDLFLFGYFANERDYLSNNLHVFLFSSFSLRPDSREIRTDRSNEFDSLFKELDATKRSPEDLFRPYIGLTTLDTKLAGHSLVALQVEPDSPAAKAGLEEGDSILTVNGQPASSFQINQWIASHSVGSELQFDIGGANGQRKVSVKSAPLPALLIAPGTGNRVFRNGMIVQLDALRQLLKPESTSELNVILLNQALAHMEAKGWNEALESLKAFQEKAADGPVLQAAVYYYRGLCFEQLADKAHARENFELAMKEANRQLPSHFFFDYQTLSEWRRNYLR